MKSLKILFHDKPLYEALFFSDSTGIRGYIRAVYYTEKGKLAETNPNTEFYIANTGSLHFTSEYVYFAEIKYSIAFEYLKRQLFIIGLEHDLLDDTLKQSEGMNLWQELKFAPALSYELKELTNLDNLSYLFEHMMFYDCSPTVTSEFLNKLEIAQSNNEFDDAALIVIEDIGRIVDDESIIELKKVSSLKEAINNNVRIFEDYEKSLEQGE